LELDARLAARLASEESGRPLFVEIGDAAFMDADLLLTRHAFPRPLPLLGNLPYESATPMIRAFVRRPDLYSRLVVMIQKEVADRLLAPPGGDEYGYLTLDVGAHARAERLFNVSPSDFDPPPRVRSTVLRLRPQAAPPGTTEALALASLGFSARRKTLATALVPRFPREATHRALSSLGLREDARAEVLGLEHFRALAARLAGAPGGDVPAALPLPPP
jgi:16S rRNA (adenine1518-N6/adenine1519-N6)-dimethyltransferase